MIFAIESYKTYSQTKIETFATCIFLMRDNALEQSQTYNTDSLE